MDKDRRLFLVLDTETTGFSAVNDEILEVAFVLTDFVEMYAVLSTYVRPQAPFITNQHNGITPEMVRHAPPFDDIAAGAYALLALADTHCAYQASFDLRFLREALARCGYRLPLREVYDPLRRLPHKQRLREACAQRNIKCDDIEWHSALGDCVATYRLTRAMLESDGRSAADAMREEVTFGLRF